MNCSVSSPAACPAPPYEAARCPLCGAPNDCQLCTSAAYKGPCWCERLSFPEELLARVPAEARNRACVCRSCVEQALRARPTPRPSPGDFYFDSATGYLVFTEQYHRKRGYCCDSGCRHCPWRKPGAGNRKSALPGTSQTGIPSSAGASVASPSPLPLAGGEGRGEVGAEKAECGRRNAELPTAGPIMHHALRSAPALCVALLFLVWPTLGASLTEEFALDPAARGWQAHGNTNLFAWNAAAQRLDVTWDTANPHSFFALPLPQTLTTNDDFAFGFDLQLTSAAGGVRANRPGAMPLSLGVLNLERAHTNNYLRGAGKAAETVEFTWFPTGFIPGFGEVEPTQSTIAFDNAGKVAASFTFPLELATNTLHRVRVAFRAADRTLVSTLTSGGETVALEPLKLPATLGDFALDAFAVLVWNEATSFGDSLLAEGWVDNVTVELPAPPVGALTLVNASPATVEFLSQRGWRYTLEASGDFVFWSELGSSASGTGETLRLSDFRRAFFWEQFYRVRADRE